MSRIHDILSKAERDGTARRMRAVPAAEAEAAVAPPLPAPIDGEPRLHDDASAFRVSPVAVRDSEPARPYAAGHYGAVATPADARAIEGAQLDPLLVAGLAPQSLAAEQYRGLRTRIAQMDHGRAARVVAITSPGKGEGKSVNAANLALTMAQESQRRVLLVDADLRRPHLHELLGLTEGAGLADVLMGTADLESALVTLTDYHLTVLPAGAPPARPGELLSSTAMRRTMDTLRQRFDQIVIDLPPVAPLADVQILTPLVDAVVLIVRAGLTPRPAIERALGSFERTKVLGLVLNESDAGERTGYDEYGALSA